MLGEGQKQSTENKSFDTQESSPSKLADGEAVELRLLGNYSTGHMDFVFRCPVEERQPDGTLRFAGCDYGLSASSWVFFNVKLTSGSTRKGI